MSELERLQLIQDLELEMMADMYNRMSSACHKKCEAVCIDRCVAKYLEIHDRVGKKLTSLSSQDEDFMKKMQGEQK
ncbi:unnamed protein product [Nesidiocoris tenuis]|uniref:Mitochondrial import inner membrane translocase subunit n=1 Tax=Nesidiocoris tenuis TaxID=355587 RepID=A0A6H5GC59_9HEMI|nr:unnamed protein product [Nesidiocoris tenuis]CAB0001068.1 unnamed protein product [Nesidiocoris tenuis]